jgi:hypothetical protein
MCAKREARSHDERMRWERSSGMQVLTRDVIVLDKRHVHPRVGRAVRASAEWRGGYGAAGGCDEEGGGGGEE